MFARLASKIFQRDAVAALVVVRRRVQRLMKVADEVNGVAERFGAFGGLGGFIFENRDLRGERFVNAAFFAAIWIEFAVTARGASRDVDVVPRTVAALAADIVGPRCGVAHRVVDGGAAVALELRVDGIFFQQCQDKSFRFRRQMFFSNESDSLVPFAAPGVGGRGG